MRAAAAGDAAAADADGANIRAAGADDLEGQFQRAAVGDGGVRERELEHSYRAQVLAALQPAALEMLLWSGA